MPRLHPNLAHIYHEKVAKLTEALNDENSRTEAAEAIRTLIDEVRRVPDGGTLKIELFGELWSFSEFLYWLGDYRAFQPA